MSNTPHYTAILPTPFGALGVVSEGSQLARIDLLPPGTAAQPARRALDEIAVAEISRYLADPTHTPQLPLHTAGTDFQQRVWAEIRAIPAGQTRTYGNIAQRLQSAPRAVGQACGANPYPLIVPCHRVVAAHAPGGFANARGGYLLDAKRWLLAHERT